MYVLYASQNGNAETVAKNVYDTLDITNKDLVKLNDSIDLFKNKDFDRDFFIVVSTTGDGEVPLNGELWWKYIKNRSLEKSSCIDCKYHILALGDSNYTSFCGAAKKINRRLQELGAKLMTKIIYIDDATDDYEEKIFESMMPFLSLNPLVQNHYLS